MRAPGFDGELVNNPDHSLSWLGERIADDPRFATAAIKFWWPAIMGSEVPGHRRSLPTLISPINSRFLRNRISLSLNSEKVLVKG